MMDEDGGWPAVVNLNLNVVMLFLLRCQTVGKAAQMALITCHSLVPTIPMIDEERKKERMKIWLEYFRYLPYD